MDQEGVFEIGDHESGVESSLNRLVRQRMIENGFLGSEMTVAGRIMCGDRFACENCLF